MASRNSSPSKSSYSISIPKFSLKNTSYVPLLMAILLIASFFLGRLTSQVEYLQKGAAPTAPNAVAGAPTTPAPGQKVNVAQGHFPIRGDKNAKVKIIEFADFRCPFCEQYFTQTESQIMKDYVNTGKANYAFRQYAFLGPASTVAANAAECANEQGKFWEFHEYLYKNQPPETDTTMYTTEKLTQAAATLGINADQFSSCLSSNKYQSLVDTDLKEGQTAGVSGTPTIFINGTPIVGAQPYATIKQQIEAELAK